MIIQNMNIQEIYKGGKVIKRKKSITQKILLIIIIIKDLKLKVLQGK